MLHRGSASLPRTALGAELISIRARLSHDPEPSPLHHGPVSTTSAPPVTVRWGESVPGWSCHPNLGRYASRQRQWRFVRAPRRSFLSVSETAHTLQVRDAWCPPLPLPVAPGVARCISPGDRCRSGEVKGEGWGETGGVGTLRFAPPSAAVFALRVRDGTPKEVGEARSSASVLGSIVTMLTGEKTHQCWGRPHSRELRTYPLSGRDRVGSTTAVESAT